MIQKTGGWIDMGNRMNSQFKIFSSIGVYLVVFSFAQPGISANWNDAQSFEQFVRSQEQFQRDQKDKELSPAHSAEITEVFEQQDKLDHDIMDAVRSGDVNQIENLLQRGANPNYSETIPAKGGGETPLYLATKNQYIDCVRILLAHGADPLKRPKKYFWKFAFAAASIETQDFNEELFDLLLSGVDQLPPADDVFFDWVVCKAVKRGDTNTLQKMERLGVDLGAIPESGHAVISAALGSGHFDLAENWLKEYSLQHAQNSNAAIRVDSGVEYLASHPWQDAEMAALLEKISDSGLKLITNKAVSKNSRPPWERAQAYRLPLTAAALGCPQEEVAKIAPRSDVELMVAASKHADTLPLFTNLAERIISNSTNHTQTASRLFRDLASYRSNMPQKDAFSYLLLREAEINQEGQSRWGVLTPLQTAILNRKNLDLAEWLLDQGADINYINRSTKTTALACAVFSGKKEFIIWALEHGTIVQEDKTGSSLITPLLRRKDTDELIDLLIEKGADLYLGVESQNSPIDWLAEQRDLIHLRARDSRGIYQALIDEYTPAKDSPFVGNWLNNNINLILTPDGHAFLRGYYTLGPFLWKATQENQATIEIAIRDLREDWIVEWIAEYNAVHLIRDETNRWDRLLRQGETPPTAMEYIERYRSENWRNSRSNLQQPFLGPP